MGQYDYATLKSLLSTAKGKAYAEAIEKFYLKEFADEPLYVLPFHEYKRFWTDGNRVNYDTAYGRRRNRLFLLQVLALADDKYLSPFEDVLAAICDEYTWVLAAHDWTPIDLFSSETGACLAESVYIFKDKLSDRLVKRIKDSVYRQIIVPYEANKICWETDFVNNWVAVCACGVGLTYMYLFPERFESVKERLFDMFKKFVKVGLDDDGYCTEGVGYWQYGFGMFCVFFDAYIRMFDERPDFIDCQKIKNTLSYVNNARMQQNVYLPFSDGGYKQFNMDCLLCAFVKSLYGDAFVMPETVLNLGGGHSLGLALLYNLNVFKNQTETLSEVSCYYECAQVFIRRRAKYAFAVKGGNNDEMHNHNDVGAFQIVKDGKRYICDVGVGEYTKDYFGAKRYENFTCNAKSHSVPIIDGKLQHEGKSFCGKVLKTETDSFAIDIAAAYENPIEQAVVTYVTRENGVDVIYELKGLKESVAFHFVSDIEPKLEAKKVRIEDMSIACSEDIAPSLSVEKYIPAHNDGKTAEAYMVDYELLKKGDVVVKFSFEF